MKRKASLVFGGLLVGASMAVMPSASAQAIPLCAGTANTAVVCVDPTGGTPIEDCIYLGTPPCTPVSVPTPTAGCSSNVLTVQVLCYALRGLV